MSLLTSMLGGVGATNQSLNTTDTPTFTGLKTLLNNGTVNTGTTVVEYGDGFHHTSVFTVSTTLPAIAGGAALAIGKLIYTLPAGAIIIHGAYISMGITQTQGNINANTPDVGLGTTIGSGVNALLSAVGAAAENILTGQTAANCTGTATVKTVNTPVVIAAADDHTIYFNAAASWAASGDAAALLAGTIVIDWSFMA